MSNIDKVKIEVDGREIDADPGSMLIEATDAAGIYVPRFCYHKNLTVAANCRMCLVEVERAPKPMPACATPVSEGMKVFTRSEKATSAQHATMEFLLINHPLDCPVCDQGGECELQDLAMGYGSGVSQFTEGKRVVQDKDIGPLVQTEMTRCIHCTRCVRFGEEIAGLRELGATGRGENMEIGTYVEKAMRSELSGNVIDLCPVGALTNKPYRFSARAWELKQLSGVAPHDCLGSNLYFHVKGQHVKRIVPRENTDINETWLSDRDRYSFEGMHHQDRLAGPRIKEDGQWVDCDWETAFSRVTSLLNEHPMETSNDLVGLISPSSTTEEFYLFQQLLRGLGSNSVDHRLRQVDFRKQSKEPLFPNAGDSLISLEQADTVVIVGSYPRHEAPLLNLRIRKAVLKGAKVIYIDTHQRPFNYAVSKEVIMKPSKLAPYLKGLAESIIRLDDSSELGELSEIDSLASLLVNSKSPFLVCGSTIQCHADRSVLIEHINSISSKIFAQKIMIESGANAAGAWLAGAIPHREAGGEILHDHGKDALEALSSANNGYVLMGIDPLLDTAIPSQTRRSLGEAKFVVSISSFATDSLLELSDVILPMALYAENEGCFVNATGIVQNFNSVIKPFGESRPAWKILRVLGSKLGLSGFDAIEVADVLGDSLRHWMAREFVATECDESETALVLNDTGLEMIVEIPMYRTDSLVRHADSLQKTLEIEKVVRICSETASSLGLPDREKVTARLGDKAALAEVIVDDAIAPGAVHVLGACSELLDVLDNCGQVSLEKTLIGAS
jgi:NADH-quinone oxidoreductase subunit G